MARKEYYLANRERICAENRAFYQAHRERYRKQARERSQRNRKILKKSKQQPCTDCGLAYPWYVMEFDHIEKKKYKVSAMTAMATSTMLKELQKCEVVCANCHRARTHARRVGWTKSGMIAGHFPSTRAMVQAGEKEWLEVEGIGKTMAKRIWDKLEKE